MGVDNYTVHEGAITPESVHSEQSDPVQYDNRSITLPKVPFPEAVQVDPILAARRRPGTFENDSLESFYKPVDSYEGAHRYDPNFEWEPQEERRVVRKVYTVVDMFHATMVDKRT